MSRAQACPRCGAALPPDAPQALCPRWLFALGLDEAKAPDGETARPVRDDPASTPAPEEADPLRELGDYELLEEIGRGGMGWIDGVAWSPSGECLAIAGGHGVTLLQTGNWRVAATLRGHLLSVHSLAFFPDGSRLATGSNLKEAMKLWDLTTLQEVATLEGRGTHFFATRFSPDGNTLVGINLQGTAHFWRAPSLAEVGLRAASDGGPR